MGSICNAFSGVRIFLFQLFHSQPHSFAFHKSLGKLPFLFGQLSGSSVLIFKLGHALQHPVFKPVHLCAVDPDRPEVGFVDLPTLFGVKDLLHNTFRCPFVHDQFCHAGEYARQLGMVCLAVLQQLLCNL